MNLLDKTLASAITGTPFPVGGKDEKLSAFDASLALKTKIRTERGAFSLEEVCSHIQATEAAKKAGQPAPVLAHQSKIAKIVGN